MDVFAAPRARLGLAALVLGSRAGGAKLRPALIAAARSRVLTTTQRRAQNIAEDDAVTCISQTRCVTAAEDPQQPMRRPVVVRGGAGRVSFIVEDGGKTQMAADQNQRPVRALYRGSGRFPEPPAPTRE